MEKVEPQMGIVNILSDNIRKIKMKIIRNIKN